MLCVRLISAKLLLLLLSVLILVVVIIIMSLLWKSFRYSKVKLSIANARKSPLALSFLWTRTFNHLARGVVIFIICTDHYLLTLQRVEDGEEEGLKEVV